MEAYELYYILIWAFAIFFLVRVMQDPSLIYHYPYIISFGFVVFTLPQVVLVYTRHIFPADSINRLFLMTVLCWGMAFAGWYSYKPKSFIFRKIFLKSYDETKLSTVSAVFIVVGIFFNIISYRILNTEDFGGQATGIVTIYLFFQQLLFLGTGLCLSLWLKNRKSINLIFAIVGILYGLYIGILLGRRTQALYTLIILGLPFFLYLKRKPSRLIILSFMILSLLVIPSMSQYRQILKTSKDTSSFFQRLFSEMDFQKNLKEFYINAKSIELVNGGYVIDYVYRTSNYRMGTGYWNALVFRFVPAQLVGGDIKKSLMLDFDLFAASRKDVKAYNPNYIPGGTTTGMADAFREFDYWGCFFFFFVGIFMKRIWFTIKETRNHFLIVLYAIQLVDAIISVTHSTSTFLPGFISTFIFLFFAQWLCNATE
jgi:hypothetical protein